MTRNSEIDCDDLRDCDHKPETPIVENGVISGWLCPCGRRVAPEVKTHNSKKGKVKP